MEAYSEFANVYDIFMEDTPYQSWVEFINKVATSEGVTLTKVCELGCGTGQITRLFARQGASVIGIDYSPEMLMIAQDDAYEEKVDILYLMQDMSQFEIGQEVDLICSCCDSINYLLEDEQVKETFRRVYESLKVGGLFVFDLNTIYKYKEVLGERTFADQNEQAAYIWENFYDEAEKVNEYQVNFFIKREGDHYERTVENHYQRGYSQEEITRWLEEVGLHVLGIYDNYQDKPLTMTTERMTFVVQK